MVTFQCADCGQEWETKVERKGPRYCKTCAEKRRKEGRGPVQMMRKGMAVAAATPRVTVLTVRTTLALPEELLRDVDQAVWEGKAKSRNELVAVALLHEMATLERAAIDAEFAEMAEDRAYQEEARKIAQEFARADWGAFRIAEQDL